MSAAGAPTTIVVPEMATDQPKLATVKLPEIAEAAGCSNTDASDIRRGKWSSTRLSGKMLWTFGEPSIPTPARSFLYDLCHEAKGPGGFNFNSRSA